ncbi:hypothetical protein BBJ28_00007862 [Nothophytophthora sp. Chile5]|nr:hypothetical protein BBJ28_00007862 [Nothophytophthora sp. Chile5]
MARRKPARVQRHAQQLKRPHEAHAAASGSQKRRKGPHHRQRKAPLSFSVRSEDGHGWSSRNVLRLSLPIPPEHDKLIAALNRLCRGVEDDEDAVRIGVALLSPPSDHVTLFLLDAAVNTTHQDGDEDALVLGDLFPDTYAAWQSRVLSLVERELLSMEIVATRDEEQSASSWSFEWAVAVAWHKYMALCHSRGQTPIAAAPRASPLQAMHHVMIWLLKHSHEASAASETPCTFRYWNEVQVLYDRFVGSNTQACVQFESQTFAMPEIYARIDAARQLQRDTSVYDAKAAVSSELLPTLRPYQKAAVSWMLSREEPSSQRSSTLPTCVTFGHSASHSLQAYDPFCAAFHAAPSPDQTLQQQQEQERLRPMALDLSTVRGGILADEMGLGKTVEVIALVLSHRRHSLRPRLVSTHSSSLPREEDDQEGEGDVMACICGTTDEHPLGFVQCDFCGTWHHQLCTGFVADDAPPSPSSSAGNSPTSSPATSATSSGLWDFDVLPTPSDAPSSPWPSGGFMCYHCQSHERPRFASHTTLIVSPEPIHAQWEHELSRHVRAGALSVLRYPGVRALRARLGGKGPSAEWQVLASPGLLLARYDIVLTTYEALSADLHHVPTAEGGARRSSTRRRRKPYAFVGSPLVALHFWRICMDEAQVGVENTRLQAALTVARLSAAHRWVVTGTPFSARVGELFGYLRFLRISPYAASQKPVEDPEGRDSPQKQTERGEQEALDLGYFRESVERNFTRGAIERVLDLLLWNGQDEHDPAVGGGILWRTGKKHVLDQLNLPPQKTDVVWCRFAAVERHFYDQQEKLIVSLVQQRQRQQQEEQQDREPTQTGDVIARDDRLWQDLLVLRQLCCHPQVGGARNAWGASGASTGGAVLTMDAFLQELVSKAARECEEAQRKLVGAQNGLAALLVLDHDPSGAVLKYLAVMRLVRTNWPRFRADLLPRLHILQNLEQCVQRLYPTSSSTRPQGESGGGEGATAVDGELTADPRKTCLLPELPTLERRISATGLVPDSDEVSGQNRTAISRECALLGRSARHIRRFYLLQVETAHSQARRSFQEVSQELNDGQQQRSSGGKTAMLCTSGSWWSDAIGVVEQSEQDSGQQLVARVQARLAGFGTRWGAAFCGQLVSARALRLLLVRELEALAKRRRVLFDRLAALSDGTPTAADVELSGNCAKCRDGGTGPVCVHCQLYKELDAYRQHFLGVDKTAAAKMKIMDLLADEDDDDGAEASTSAGDAGGAGGSTSLLVEVFKEIAGCARTALRSRQDGRVFASEIQTAMQRETEFWAKLQREWRAAKRLFQAQHQRLGALDELVMACSQLRLRQPGEPEARTRAERLYKLELYEVPIRAAELEAERAAADFDLRDKLAQLRYLLQLQTEAEARQTQQQRSSSSARPLCAVCLQELAQTRAMLPCAHAFCLSCVSTLAGGQHTRKNVRCPTCRRVCAKDSIATTVEGSASIVEAARAEAPADTGGIVQAPQPKTLPHQGGGGLGSKLDALLERVDALRQENPSVKCLLFSQWPQMLALAVQALPRLGVRCFTYSTKRQLPTLLAQFQTCPAACVLALPFKVGANGLNIVEATEVLLVEPLLSATIEAQAVNRVHRVGQTRRTRVHRFIVQESIEERIYGLGKKHRPVNRGAEGVDAEQADDEEDDDVEAVTRLGVAPGRKEQEKLTMRDLQELLNGRVDSVAGPEEEAASEQASTSFWETLVVLNGKSVSRRAALEFLERRRAAELRLQPIRGEQRSQHEDHEPNTMLFCQQVALRVAEEVLALAYPVADASSTTAVRTDMDESASPSVEHADAQLLQRHRDRVREEIAVWQSATAAATNTTVTSPGRS